FTGSEFGKICQRYWKGRLPFHFGGGNNFVDVRDVARGVRLAAERGRAGERYLVGGENPAYNKFFDQLRRAAGRFIPSIRLPNRLAPVLGLLSDRWYRRRSREPFLSRSRAAMMGLFFFFDSAKARQELGYETRPLAQSIVEAHEFWTPKRKA